MTEDQMAPRWSHGRQTSTQHGTLQQPCKRAYSRMSSCPPDGTSLEQSPERPRRRRHYQVGAGLYPGEEAAEHKRTKWLSLPTMHAFVPVAFQSLGPLNSTGPVIQFTFFNCCPCVRSVLMQWHSGALLFSMMGMFNLQPGSIISQGLRDYFCLG